ncbi:MAG: hypothetical protein KUG81_09475 [Gammaproteobacteria bacterium]|nr:hypothetical protein [Gammaproteobacteria bacterium]
MASQRKWSSAKPGEISRREMVTKLKIFHDKFGTDVPPDETDIDVVKAYYNEALKTIEENSNKNYSILQMSLEELVDDVDEEDPGRKKSGCCSRFWDWVCNLCIFRSCISQVED